MRIIFQRMGGFAGLRLSTTLESQNLDEADVKALEVEIKQANFLTCLAGLSRWAWEPTASNTTSTLSGSSTSIPLWWASLPCPIRSARWSNISIF